MSSMILLSISDQVYKAIKDRILAGDLPPGTRIIETKVSNEYTTSRLPVREALQRLAADGLVEIYPRRGTFVANLDFEQAAEVLDIIGALLGLAARNAATKVSDKQLAYMRNSLLDVLDVIKKENGKRYPHENYDINADILAITGNSHMNKILSEMKQKIDLIRVNSPSKRSMEITLKIWQEHWDIYEGLSERSPEKAARAAIRHLEEVKHRLRSDFTMATAGGRSDGRSSH